MHTNFNISQFISGLRAKLAEEFVSPDFTAINEPPKPVVNSSIFPTIDKQQSWKFARSGNNLRLHDGNVIHTFHADEFKDEEDFPATKLEDTSYFDFNKDMTHTGTAQIHRANPGMAYVTLHDGGKNPTFTLTHVNEDSWRISPKVKKKPIAKKAEIDLEEFKKGIKAKLGFDAAKLLDTAGNYMSDGVKSLGNNPLLSAGVGVGLGGAYDLGRRALYNSDEENEQESFGQRATRWLAPGAVAGGAGMLMKDLLPNYYATQQHSSAFNTAAKIPNYVKNPSDRLIGNY